MGSPQFFFAVNRLLSLGRSDQELLKIHRLFAHLVCPINMTHQKNAVAFHVLSKGEFVLARKI